MTRTIEIRGKREPETRAMIIITEFKTSATIDLSNGKSITGDVYCKYQGTITSTDGFGGNLERWTADYQGHLMEYYEYDRSDSKLHLAAPNSLLAELGLPAWPADPDDDDEPAMPAYPIGSSVVVNVEHNNRWKRIESVVVSSSSETLTVRINGPEGDFEAVADLDWELSLGYSPEIHISAYHYRKNAPLRAWVRANFKQS